MSDVVASQADTVEKLNSEIRRGALVLAVLSQLRTEHYGYSLRKTLSEHGLDVEEGTLYPLIRRLEKQSLLVSEWREEAKRRQRFYQLSAHGHGVYRQLLADWRALNESLISLTGMPDDLSRKDSEPRIDTTSDRSVK